MSQPLVHRPYFESPKPRTPVVRPDDLCDAAGMARESQQTHPAMTADHPIVPRHTSLNGLLVTRILRLLGVQTEEESMAFHHKPQTIAHTERAQ